MDKPEVSSVRVVPVTGRRVAGWTLRCSEHGLGQVAFRTKKLAIGHATAHSDEVHGGNAVIVHP